MKKLFDLDPNEVSLVPRGANKKKFLIFKSKEGKPMPTRSEEIRNLINSVDAKTMAKIDKVLKAMPMKKMEGQEGEDADKSAAEPGKESKPLSDRAQAALKAVARIIAPFKDEISDEHLDAVQNEVGIAPTESEDEETPKDEIEMSVAYPEGVEEEHHAEALGKAKKMYMDHLEKMGYRKYPDQQPKVGSVDGDMDDEDEDEEEEEESVSKVAKSGGALDLSAFPQGQRAQLEAIFKTNTTLAEENKTLIKKTADLEKELKVERDQRVLKEFTEKAKSFRHLGANTDDLAAVLKSLNDKDPEICGKVENILKASDEQVRVAAKSGGLFSEIGSRQGRAAGGSYEAQIDALVDSIVQKSDGQRTREQIYDEVLKSSEGKRLYGEFKLGRPGGI